MNMFVLFEKKRTVSKAVREMIVQLTSRGNQSINAFGNAFL